jgi:thiol-disulfide isomerase/thioredoxin
VGSDAAFTKLEESKAKQVYYFTASWCPPCKMIGPVFEKMAPEYPEIKFLKVDVDENPEAAGKFQISSVPTFLFSDDGEILGSGVVGADEVGIRGQLHALNER